MYIFKITLFLFILFGFNLLTHGSSFNDVFKIQLPFLSSQNKETPGKCENLVMLITEKIRKIMPTGSKFLGIPPLEPFRKGKTFVNGSHPDLGNITGYITDLVVEQLSTFEVTNIKCKLLALHPKVYLNATIPFLKINGNYDLSGYAIDLVPLYGNGPFSVNITNLYAGIIATSNIYWTLSDLNIWLKIDESQIYFYNLLDGGEYEDLFNRMFSAIGPIAVEDLWPPVEPFISDMIVQIVNKKLPTWNNFL